MSIGGFFKVIGKSIGKGVKKTAILAAGGAVAVFVSPELAEPILAKGGAGAPIAVLVVNLLAQSMADGLKHRKKMK